MESTSSNFKPLKNYYTERSSIEEIVETAVRAAFPIESIDAKVDEKIKLIISQFLSHISSNIPDVDPKTLSDSFSILTTPYHIVLCSVGTSLPRLPSYPCNITGLIS